MSEDEGRKRLAEEVKAARGRKYRTVERARAAVRISRGAWDAVENGKPVKPFTLAAVEDALGWPAGRAQQIIAGQDVGQDDELRGLIAASGHPEHVKRAMLELLDDAAAPPGTERGVS